MREAPREAGLGGAVRIDRGCAAGGPRLGPCGQFGGSRRDFRFDLGALVSPRLSAHAVERALGAVAPDAIQLVGGDEQLRAVGEGERDALLGRPVSLDIFQAGEPRCPVLDVDDNVADARRVVPAQLAHRRSVALRADQVRGRQDKQVVTPETTRDVERRAGHAARDRVRPVGGGANGKPALLEAARHFRRIAGDGDHHGRGRGLRARDQIPDAPG